MPPSPTRVYILLGTEAGNSTADYFAGDQHLGKLAASFKGYGLHFSVTSRKIIVNRINRKSTMALFSY